MRCGSIEAFLANPSLLKESDALDVLQLQDSAGYFHLGSHLSFACRAIGEATFAEKWQVVKRRKREERNARTECERASLSEEP